MLIQYMNGLIYGHNFIKIKNGTKIDYVNTIDVDWYQCTECNALAYFSTNERTIKLYGKDRFMECKERLVKEIVE